MWGVEGDVVPNGHAEVREDGDKSNKIGVLDGVEINGMRYGDEGFVVNMNGVVADGGMCKICTAGERLSRN